MKRWVETYVANTYMACLEDTSQVEAKKMFDKCSNLDHVFAILTVLSKGEATSIAKKDKLAKPSSATGSGSRMVSYSWCHVPTTRL